VSSKKREIHLQIYQVIDALLIGLTYWFCYELRSDGVFNVDIGGDIPAFERGIWILALCVPIGPVLLEFQGFYSYPLEKTFWKSFRQVLGAVAWLGLALGICAIFLRLEVPSRSVLLMFALCLPFVLLLRERLTTWWYLRGLRAGKFRELVILAGEPEQMKVLLRHIPASAKLEWNVVEKVDLVDGSIEQMVEKIHRHGVGRVILCFQKMELDKVQRAIAACEVEGIEAWLNADFIRTSIARPTYESLAGRPMMVFRATPEISWAILTKNLTDRVAALIGLILLSPILLLVALMIRFSSPGPVIFRQKRAGLHGKPFTMFKFRSMCVDAEHLQKQLEAKNEMSGPVFKVSNDPRVTPLGSFLRKTSIDELPQLYNVLRGEMSLVGPRPLPLYEVDRFDKASYRRRLSMKPGLTCLWQVRGRSSVTDFEDWVKMDLEYIDNWSLPLDFWILFRTLPVVLFGRGAK
jgi:exopolysaccharide biosynthesis polyprenyl glycosylphosphotransferase